MTPRQLPSPRRDRAGFSLVEMIGVLAIIAILAVIILPKVFATISSSRVTNAVGSVNSMRSAVLEFAGKHGTLPTTGNNSRFDDLLVTTGILDQRFQVRIGTQPMNPPIAGATWTRNATTGAWTASGGSNQTSQTRLISLTANSAEPNNGNNYRLDGTTDLPAGSRVVSAVITGLTAVEARELSLRIDGDVYSQPATGTPDRAGRVVYNVPTGNGTYTAYIYLAHQ
jgi:prepilin-type N-terminal cleavage/methylation domain-containing protein